MSQKAFDILYDETHTNDEDVFKITKKTITSFCRKSFKLPVIQYGKEEYYITIDEKNTYNRIDYFIPVPMELIIELIDKRVLLLAGDLNGMPKYYARPYLGEGKEFQDRRTDNVMVNINNSYYLG